MNRGEEAAPHGAGRRAMLAPCVECASDHYEILYDSGCFFAVCPSCGRRGPDAASLYEALMGWRQMNDRRAQSIWGMLLAITTVLCVIVASLALGSLMLR